MHKDTVKGAAKDMKAYLGAYDKSFDPPGNQNRSAWE